VRFTSSLGATQAPNVFIFFGRFTDLTTASGSGASIWSYNPKSGELTVNLPKAGGGTEPGQFSFDVEGDDIEIVTDWAAYEAEQTEPSNKQPVPVRLYLVT
jgi:fructose-1,6-bisphosphatase